jgi:hypothetical protein
MSTPTTELGLLRAVDADDTADYLVTNLANSLTTVDSLFNNVSGHTHSGAHQGGPVNTVPAAGTVTNAMLGPDVARANLLTNGGFEIWQRGAGPFTGSVTGSADRWAGIVLSGDTLSVSQDNTNYDANSGSLVAAACAYTGTGSGNTYVYQDLKNADGYQIRGGLPMSFSMRVRTATANAVQIRIGADGTGSPSAVSSIHPGDGTYHTLTATVTVPFNATTVRLSALFLAAATVYLDNAMVVRGSVPADYVPLHPADELVRCERYYEVISDGTNGASLTTAQAYAPQNFQAYLRFRTWKPVTPTLNIAGASNFSVMSAGAVAQTVSALPASSATRLSCFMNGSTSAASLVAGNATNLSAGNGGTVSAEANP